jgi:ribonuclease HI
MCTSKPANEEIMGKNKDRSGWWHLHFDGGSRGNPGHSAGGFHLFPYDRSLDIRGAEPMTGDRTNNEAEYFGLIVGLRAAIAQHEQTPMRNLVIHGDSSLVVNQISGDWAVKAEHLMPLFDEARALMKRLPRCSINWHRRTENTIADEQVNLILDATFGPVQKVTISDDGQFDLPSEITPAAIARIKIPGGRDRFTAMRLPKLLELIDNSAPAQVLDLWQADYADRALEEKDLATVIRWHLRGLSLPIAVQKVAIELAKRDQYAR